MTVFTNNRRREHPGNGVATVFAGPRVFNTAQMEVYLVDQATSVSTPLALGADYAIQKIGFQESVVVMTEPPATGVTLLLLRTLPSQQPFSIKNQGAFFADIHEDAFDYRAMFDQQLQDQLDRAIRFPETLLEGFNPFLPVPSALQLIGWNASGTQMQNFDPEMFGIELAAGVTYRTTVAEGQTVVPLSIAAPFGVQAVFLNGIYQDPAGYVKTPSGLTFNDPLPASGIVSVLSTFNRPPDADVSALFYTPTPAGTVTRQIAERLGDQVSMQDYGVVADGVTDDTAAARVAAGAQMGLVVPAGIYNLSEDVYLFGDVSDGVKYTGPGRFITAHGFLELSKRFFVQNTTDNRNVTVPMLLRRQVRYYADAVGAEPDELFIEDGTNSTALGLALHFLAQYATWSPNKIEEVLPHIQSAADYLASMQYRDDRYARYGGFRGGSNAGEVTTFGTACAARGLLAAFKATGVPLYLEACRRAVAFLKVMHDPNPKYIALYGETPIPAVPENATYKGFCDRVATDDKINITSSCWNLVAVVFLQEMFELEGDPDLPDIIADVRDFQAFGVLNGLDYFAIKNAAPSAKVSVAWPFFSGHSYADGQWHRYGEPAGTNTVGTDQIEYGIASLYTVGYSVAALRTAYETYRDLTHYLPASSFGLAYDPAICWSGFFRINSTVYGGIGGNVTPIDPASSRHFGSYYDLQGAGTLLKFKYDHYPDDFRASFPVTMLAWDRGFGLTETFESLWSLDGSRNYISKGVIPVAKSCMGILEVLESAP